MMDDAPCTGYKPIADYAAIGNLRTVALVGLDGAIDWCCLPKLDAPAVFAALLDARRGGRFRVAPAGAGHGTQRYVPDTNVLETRFEVDGGCLVVTDFMSLQGTIRYADDPDTTPALYRVLRCEAGEVDVAVEWSPRFDFAQSDTRIDRVGAGCFLAQTGPRRFSLGGLPEGSAVLESDAGGPVVRARFRLSAGDRVPLVARYGAEDPRCDPQGILGLLDETVAVWHDWRHFCDRPKCSFEGPWHDLVVRSGLALKLLTHPDTGAIAAAATTSLPEEIGGVRNWDYRYSWIRDAAFTVQALVALGHRAEALDFVEWVHRVSKEKGTSEFKLQIMYGLHGEKELTEMTLDHLEGYCGSRPVRVGNGAFDQHQLDIYGELLGSAYEYLRQGERLAPELMRFLSVIADRACDVWREPDAGIWEVRGGHRHFVYSKLMVWVALDRAITMSEKYGLTGDVHRWAREREEVCAAILSEGYDPGVGAFVQSFGSKDLDAANLLIPVVEFLPPDDPRVQGTIDRTLERLTENGVVYRYLNEDGLPGGEGAFGLTTFWMIDALALSGRLDEASELFEGMARRANHVGLYAEEFDPRTGAFLGNFPQAFSHVGFINSALYLARARGHKAPTPAPIGSRQHGAEAGHDTGAAA